MYKYIYIIIIYIPVVPTRGGAKVASGIYDQDLLIYRELACAMRQPGQRVRALCEAVAALLSKNMTCARPRCNATPRKDFLHTSHCTLHTPHFTHFTLHTCTSHSTLHLISNHASSSHLISALLISSLLFSQCHLSKFFSTVFISSWH